jgi:hypothetical protein
MYAGPDARGRDALVQMKEGGWVGVGELPQKAEPKFRADRHRMPITLACVRSGLSA